MELRPFGPLDRLVPVVGLGTRKFEQADREACIQTIRHAIDRGVSHIDTAELYGGGAVEELLGEALAGYRAEVFLASKVRPDHATYAGTLLACEKSLRRLRTDRLDLYLLHWRGTQPLEETIRALMTLKQDGKILAWGVSNFDVADLEEALSIAGEGEIACDQVLYNLNERDAEHMLQLVCERHRIALVAYSPLGSGHFPREGTLPGDALADIARAHNVSSRAVALRFLSRRPSAFVIPKSVRRDHLDDLASAGELVLSASELARIDEAFPLGPPKSELPYL